MIFGGVLIKDKDTQCIEELQKLLNQKSSEASKATVALRWKSLEWSKMQQIAAEEKMKLTQQMKDLIKNVSSAQSFPSKIEIYKDFLLGGRPETEDIIVGGEFGEEGAGSSEDNSETPNCYAKGG